MTALVQFLKVLLGIAPEMLPVVTKAVHEWSAAKGRANPKAFADGVIKQLAGTKEAEVDAKIDAQADAAFGRRDAEAAEGQALAAADAADQAEDEAD